MVCGSGEFNFLRVIKKPDNELLPWQKDVLTAEPEREQTKSIQGMLEARGWGKLQRHKLLLAGSLVECGFFINHQ